MGNWGIDLFEDDLALDIKDMFEELIENGQDINKVVSMILEEFGDSLEDFDEGAIVILSLSELVSEKGNITGELKYELGKISDSTEYWEYLRDENMELYKSRIQLMNKLLEKSNQR